MHTDMPRPVSKDHSMRVNMASGHQTRPQAVAVTARDDRLGQATADNPQNADSGYLRPEQPDPRVGERAADGVALIAALCG